jgi:hypothetical protein
VMRKRRVQCGRCGDEVPVVEARVSRLHGVLTWVCIKMCGPDAQYGNDGVSSAVIA